MRSVAVVSAFVCAVPLAAQSGIDSLFPARPTPFVTDAARILQPATVSALNAQARDVQSRTHGDIAVATLPTIGGFQPYEVAMQIGRAWGVGGQGAVGSAERNLGAVVLIVPKSSAHRGTCFISTGRGAEGFMTDATAGEICRHEVPLFQAGNYDDATAHVVAAVAGLMLKNGQAAGGAAPAATSGAPVGLIALFIVLILALFAVFVWYRMRLRAAVAAEKQRWDALTPVQQAAERAARDLQMERERVARERDALIIAAAAGADGASGISSGSPDAGSSSSSGSSDSFGGGGGFDGGGGGSDF